MSHPFMLLLSRERTFLFWISLSITAIGIVVLGFADPGRVNGKGPRVVGFELAGTAAKAGQIMEAWGDLGRTVAGFNLGFDYLFILGYSTAMTLACVWASQRYSRSMLIELGAVLAWLQGVAGALDCTEDASLLVMLFHGASNRAAAVARFSACGKFGLLVLGLVYILVAVI